jgi:hypothetical protein
VDRRQHQHARADTDVRPDAQSAEALEVGVRSDQRPVADLKLSIEVPHQNGERFDRHAVA